ncbi:MAG: HAMP domain-containing protein [Synergistaceae bacterium]|nr:HAMP domain-containing protein [Synergistaceae bacterium]
MRTLKSRLFLLVAATVLLSFLLAWFPLAGLVRERLHQKALSELDIHTRVIASVVAEGSHDLPQRLEEMQRIVQGRITVVDERGKVLYDSDVDASLLDNHRDRPEIAGAFASGRGEATRYSRSLGADLLYLALRAPGPDGRPCVVRASYSLASIGEALSLLRWRLLTALFLSGLLAGAVGLWFSARLVRPLKEIEEAARSVQDGGDIPFPSRGPREVETLASALRAMASRLRETLADLEAERKDLALILENLPVGVIVTDPSGRLRFANGSMAPFLRDRPDRVEGRPCQGLLRVPEIVSLVEETARSGRGEGTFLVRENQSRLFQAQAVRLQGGALVVVTDLTERHRLEEARRAFVADASHEFQTPLTAIRAAAELLLSGEDGGSEERQRYARSIIDQQERMTSLVDDLLLLSRLESGLPTENEENLDLALLVEDLVREERDNPLTAAIVITADRPPSAPFTGRPGELRRAIGNIVDNAVKYVGKRFGTGPGGTITITVTDEPGWWVLSIADNGIGLQGEDLDGLFERFQRGERDRGRIGRGQGGYGLGLAIAKGIIDGHGGTIAVERREEGASFILRLPRNAD